jgi:hypothetical protein
MKNSPGRLTLSRNHRVGKTVVSSCQPFAGALCPLILATFQSLCDDDIASGEKGMNLLRQRGMSIFDFEMAHDGEFGNHALDVIGWAWMFRAQRALLWLIERCLEADKGNRVSLLALLPGQLNVAEPGSEDEKLAGEAYRFLVQRLGDEIPFQVVRDQVAAMSNSHLKATGVWREYLAKREAQREAAEIALAAGAPVDGGMSTRAASAARRL